MTTDVDAVIRGDAVSVAELIDALGRHQIVARIENAEAFAAANLVLLARHQPTEVDLDLSFGWTVFEHEALAACIRTRYGKVAVPMARVEELLVFKAMAGRPRDVDDSITLLTLYPHVDLAHVRRRVAALAAFAASPELEQILRAAAAIRCPAQRGARCARARSPAPMIALGPGFTPAPFAPGRHAIALQRTMHGTHELQVLNEDSTSAFALDLVADGTASACRGWRYLFCNDGPRSTPRTTTVSNRVMAGDTRWSTAWQRARSRSTTRYSGTCSRARSRSLVLCT